MTYRAENLLTVRGRLDFAVAAVELQHVDLPVETEAGLPATDEYRVDLSLTPRTPDARLRFQDHWPAHRFEALGRICVVPPGQAVRTRSGAGSQDAVICYLREPMLDGLLWKDADPIGRHLDAGLDIRSTTINALMTRIGREVQAPGFASAALCQSLATQIAIELGRHYIQLDSGAAATGLAGWRLAIIDDRLRETRSPPTLAELAALCGLSIRHLTRSFRASRGCTIAAYVLEHQVEAAKRALVTGEPVKALAHQLGFASRSSFSHAFQRATGMAPAQYREREAAARRRAH